MKRISEMDEMLLSAYIDGELTEVEARELEARIGAPLDVAILDLQHLRGVVSGSLRQAGVKDGHGSIDIWQNIEAEVGKIADGYRRASSVSPARWFSGVRELFGQGFSVRSGAIGFAAAAMVMVFGQQFYADENSDLQLVIARETLTPEVMSRRLDDLVRVSFERDRQSALSVPMKTMQSYRSQLLSRAEDGLSLPLVTEVVNKDFVLGGLRSAQTDFDLIHSKRQVSLLASEDRGSPPVIWVASSSAGQNGIETVGDLRVRPEVVN